MPRALNPQITRFILANVGARPDDIGPLTAKRFAVTRATASNYLRRLTDEGLLSARGATRARSYSLKHVVHLRGIARIETGVEDDAVWRRDIRPRLEGLPQAVMQVCQYGFTAAVSNALDHSKGSSFTWWMRQDAASVELGVTDDGTGVFETLRRGFGLEDDRRAILELAKGGLSTAPDRHAGRGLYLIARMFDRLTLASGRLAYVHGEPGGAAVRMLSAPIGGTSVSLRAEIATPRSLSEVMGRHDRGPVGGWATEVPVCLAGIDGEPLVSRSQARRLMARLEAATRVTLDFDGVELIGQDFAHEIFAVFRSEHRGIQLGAINANRAIRSILAGL